MIGAMLGIALALGTGSCEGLLLGGGVGPVRGAFVPVLVDVWRFVYILWVGFKEFYKFMKYRKRKSKTFCF